MLRFGLLGTLTFLGLFIYFYKTSGKFRQSIISAFAALTVIFSSQQPAHSAGQADAFTQQNQQHQSRPKNQGIFSRKSNNDGPGPGKPNGNGSDGDDGGIPKYPKAESIEETQRHLSNIDEQIHKLEEVTDSDSETEENQCPIDQPEVNESFKSNSSLKKVTKRALGNQDVKREYKRILKRIGEGVDPMDIGRGSTDLGDGLTYVRGQNGRYIIKNDNGVKDVVGIAYRGSRNDMKTLAKEMNESYNVNIEPGGY